MPYLIDTDWTIDHLANVPDAVQLLNELADDGIAISVVTYMEVYQGIVRDPKRADLLFQFESFLAGVPIVPFSLAVARQCANLRADLKRHGKKVNSRALDLMIAATAIEHNLILVTRNTSDYQDIPNLKLYQFGNASE